MRKLKAVVTLAVAALLAAPAQAADYYPPIDVPPLPPVDYGLGGSFYLRGSAGANILTARNVDYGGCGACVLNFTDVGYGYSVGVGVGYETGDGLRADFTIDYLRNDGLHDTNGDQVTLTSGLALLNVYYDFGLDGAIGVDGGWGAYVGAGLGVGFNHIHITGVPTQDGRSTEAAAALMTGVTYDMGSVVTDLGYRMIYMDKVSDSAAAPTYVNDPFIHELRGTVRYRFN